MKMITFLTCLVSTTLGTSSLRSNYPSWTPDAKSGDTCDGIKCAPLECQPPFKWKNAEDAGTCCPLCWSDKITVPEDRSWAKGLTGGVGPANEASVEDCRGVMCPVLTHCEQQNQKYKEGRCCYTC